MTQPWRSAPPAPQLGALDQLLRGASRLLRHLPPAALASLLGEPPRNERGDALDPHVHLMLRLEQVLDSPAEPTVAERRDKMRRDIALIDGPPAPVGGLVETLLDGDLPTRVYRPLASADRPPWMLYLHGGGWATGDLDSHDRICRRLCRDTGVMVIALDYRLAPEVPFPGALEDVLRAWPAAARLAERLGAEPTWACIGGDSAGGNLAAVFCHRYRDQELSGPPPLLQLLVYPATDFRMLEPSIEEFREGFLLTRAAMDTYKALYAPTDDTHPDASPGLQPDLSRLPTTLVITAGFDPLRDEGERFARRSAEAGTPTQHLSEPHLVHGFLQLESVVPEADAAIGRMCASLSTALARLRP